MSYYTNYDFSDNSEEVINAIEEVSDYGASDFGKYFDVTWYDHDDDMKIVSKRFPDQLITLEGEGEDFPDIWKAFYKDGKSYGEGAEIVFPKFDENKLK